ncbi:XTP/dITP diphosphatase [Periweissella fabalis]|uniref:dITP/XTP pyrophosphatase n=1 Tax=Periweissella fabalis TaxID=1070421 RepID=A0A7X6S318_9LACO|nr:XTP/dITP diphosphatase [Periweissella fabalis]MCM0598565.1 XTP/dITP diphosphatase [Periweissella fabalis]NKZ24153.1 XTP/dITP diphosphatase [Periweissella fabalis]
MTDKKIILATNNAGKLKEFKTLLAPKGIEVLGLSDLDQHIEIAETGTTFAENALIKAKTIANLMQTYPVISDDSGLMVKPLNDEPGIYSARYAGDHDDAANIKKLLGKLGDLSFEDRKARFHATIAAVKPNGQQLVVSGEVEGYITFEVRGIGGFGYDPIFFSPELGKTFGEASAQEKKLISHRRRAIDAFLEQFDEWWTA